jgi:Fe-S cluster biogenesis protein NfuA
MTDDDLVAKYAAEAQKSIDDEAQKRIAETTDPILDAKLRKKSLIELLETDEIVLALLARLGSVRAALDGHGGGIKVESYEILMIDDKQVIDFVLDLTGACLSCGAAPGTLDGIKADLESDDEINIIRYSSKLLDTFDELGREFILAHGKVEFV